MQMTEVLTATLDQHHGQPCSTMVTKDIPSQYTKYSHSTLGETQFRVQAAVVLRLNLQYHAVHEHDLMAIRLYADADTGTASGSRSAYSQSGSGSGSGTDRRTISASSYSSARSRSSYTTDSRPVSAKLPVIPGAHPNAQTVTKTVTKTVTQTVVSPAALQSSGAAVKGGKQRPDTASSSGSESGSDSSYTSSSSGSSYSR